MSGLASRPVVKVTLPAASVVGLPSSGASTSTEKPFGNTTVTVPPGVPLVPKPHAANDARVVPIRVVRVAAPPGSVMSKASLKRRVPPAPSCLPKSIRSRV